MEYSRKKQTFIAITVIYQILLDFSYGNKKDVRDARDLMCDLCNCSVKDIPLYIFDLVSYSIKNYGTIVNIFSPHLNKWIWNRLPLLTQAILLISYSHFKIENINKKIIISTAIDFAKKYIDLTQSKFINAILDEVLN